MRSLVPSFVWILVGIVPMSCTSYTEDIGNGFLIRTRVQHGMAQQYEEHDLYYKGMLGFNRLIHKDIRSAEVSPRGDVVLFFARRHRPEPMGMDYILCVFDRKTKDLLKIEDGDFYYPEEFWSPEGDNFIYTKYYEPIMLFDLSNHESREIAGKDFNSLGWSPSGENIVYTTDKSVYDVNTLYVTDVKNPRGIKVEEKKGVWKKGDFEWVTEGGEEKIVVK